MSNMSNMSKEQRNKIRDMDAIIVKCALGPALGGVCDEHGAALPDNNELEQLKQMAIEYATKFRCPYTLSGLHVRSLETAAEREIARQLVSNVNNAIRYTMRRLNPGMTGLGLKAFYKLTNQPNPTEGIMLPRTCNCRATHRSPKCNMPIELCKYTTLMKTVPRSPRNYQGGKRKRSGKKASASRRRASRRRA